MSVANKNLKYLRKLRGWTQEEFAQKLRIKRSLLGAYEEERADPHGRKYYWLTGEFVNFDEGTDTDVWALANNYISVVPVQFDLTHYKLKAQLEKSWNILSDKR